MRKKSYMNKENIINESRLLDKIKKFFSRGKNKKPSADKIYKAFRNDPAIKKRISKINKDAAEIAKWYKETTGKDVPKDFFI